jgi:hypothetical protein
VVDKKPVWDCKFRDYLNPTEVEPQKSKTTKPKDFNYENKLKLQEKKQ